jgi:hypothetical protein
LGQRREPHGRVCRRIDRTVVKLFVSNNLESARWLLVILAGTALALTGCNANQAINPSEQANLRAIYYNYNP